MRPLIEMTANDKRRRFYSCYSELLWPYTRARLDPSHTFINCIMTYIRIPDAFSYDTIQHESIICTNETNTSIYETAVLITSF